MPEKLQFLLDENERCPRRPSRGGRQKASLFRSASCVCVRGAAAHVLLLPAGEIGTEGSRTAGETDQGYDRGKFLC